ncbi:MAG: 50S ribosomal protein L11 methyltransferase, partial [Kiritimatiellae bacterium]|nr:50S ribosomal protein L11 methyltransferase [Kiritimatiellia bacterium]
YERAREMADIAESVDGRIHVAQIEALAREDWTESWKKFFHIIHVTDKITIRPIWEEYEASEGELVVDIEPGMSFGTGIHPTTQSCLKFLEQLSSVDGMLDSKVIDMGCGSGILSIAAHKLGYSEVEGYDYDPAAVKVSKENAEHNGLTNKIPFDVADVTAPEPLPRGNVVVANILAVVLIDAAKAIASSVDKSKGQHALILSGILENQYEDVKAAYLAEGFVEKQSIQIGEWKSGLFL